MNVVVGDDCGRWRNAYRRVWAVRQRPQTRPGGRRPGSPGRTGWHSGPTPHAGRAEIMGPSPVERVMPNPKTSHHPLLHDPESLSHISWENPSGSWKYLRWGGARTDPNRPGPTPLPVRRQPEPVISRVRAGQIGQAGRPGRPQAVK